MLRDFIYDNDYVSFMRCVRKNPELLLDPFNIDLMIILDRKELIDVIDNDIILNSLLLNDMKLLRRTVRDRMYSSFVKYAMLIKSKDLETTLNDTEYVYKLFNDLKT